MQKRNIPFFSSSNNEITKQANNSQTQASGSINSFFKGINEFNQNQNSNDGDDVDDNYQLTVNILTMKYNNNDFSLFHLNIASLSKHKKELETILTMLNFKFDVIGISETKI